MILQTTLNTERRAQTIIGERLRATVAQHRAAGAIIFPDQGVPINQRHASDTEQGFYVKKK